jgi:glutathione S-transferase
MKLYFTPGACSLAVHIVLREAGYVFDLEQVDLRTGRTASGADYRDLNPKGYVPALVLDDGEVLTEVAAILQYLVDSKPNGDLALPPGDMAHYRLLEWLNFIGTEVHKTLGALFNPALPPECRTFHIALFERRGDWLARTLGDRSFLMGERFTIADAYLFTVLNWTQAVGIDLDRWPPLPDYMARVAARPAVHDAMVAEGLVA